MSEMVPVCFEIIRDGEIPVFAVANHEYTLSAANLIVGETRYYQAVQYCPVCGLKHSAGMYHCECGSRLRLVSTGFPIERFLGAECGRTRPDGERASHIGGWVTDTCRRWCEAMAETETPVIP